MADLTGKKIKNTYKDLLQVSNSNTGVDATLRVVEDGEGTSSALSISADAVQVDNININGNAIISADTNGDITITPNGTGSIVLDGVNWPQADGTSGQALTTDGAGQLSYSSITITALSDIADVTVTSIASGEILKWNGSAWINNTLAEAGIAATGHTHVEADITDLQPYILADSVDTLTNKTINTASNTITVAAADVSDLATATVAFTNKSGAISQWTNDSGYITATLTDEEVQDIVGAMVTTTNTETGIAVTYQDATGDIDFVVSDTTVAGDTGSTGITPGDTLTIAGGTGVGTAMSGDTLTISSVDSEIDHGSLGGLTDDDHTQYSLLSSQAGAPASTPGRVGELNVDTTADRSYIATDTASSADWDIVVTPSSTDTLTNKSGAISQWTNDSGYITSTLTQEEVEDYAGGLVATGGTKTGIAVTYQDATGDMDFVVSDTTVAGDTGSTGMTPGDTLTIAGGTNATTAMVGDTLTVNVDDSFLSNTGDAGSGTYTITGDLSVDNLNLNGNTLTSTDANGNITLTPNGTGNVTLGNYTFDADQTVGVGQDNYVLTYDNAGGLITLEAAAGGGGGIDNVVEDTTPQLGGMLDVNGNAIGDGTLELLTFTEDASAVNHINVENEATGSGPIISAAGDDTNIDLNLNGKATGNVILRDGTDVTKKLSVELAGATTSTTTTLAVSQTGNVTVTLPDATDTLVGKATTDTLTNKTFDANGTGNSLSNVDVADLADGTDGELITWDASGAPTTVATGTSGQVLTSNGAGAAPTFQAAAGGGSGAWTYVSTVTASASATVEFTGLSTAFAYMIVMDGVAPSTDTREFYVRTSTNNGSSYDSTGGDYSWTGVDSGFTSVGADGSSTDDKINLTGSDAGNELGTVSDELASGQLMIYNPSSTGVTNITWTLTYDDATSNGRFVTGGGRRLAAADVDAIQFYMESGNIASGVFKLYSLAAS